MPFVKGQEKKGGRKKGTRNKDAAPVMQRAEQLGIDPFEILLLFAAGDWKKLGYKKETIIRYSKDCQNEYLTIDPAVRARSAAEACQYLYPKRKAIEVEEINKRNRPLAKLTDEELDEL